MTRTSCLATLVGIVVCLAGCASSPAERFYALAPESPASAEFAPVVPPIVSVGPVTLPEAVDRPQIVVRINANQMAVVESHRWVEPLKDAIPRVIAGNLNRLMGGGAAVTSRQDAAQDAAMRVTVDVQRFESTLGDSIDLEAVWSVRSASGGQARAGRARFREPCASGSYEALAAAHSQALTKLSQEIAATIGAMPTGAR